MTVRCHKESGGWRREGGWTKKYENRHLESQGDMFQSTQQCRHSPMALHHPPINCHCSVVHAIDEWSSGYFSIPISPITLKLQIV